MKILCPFFEITFDHALGMEIYARLASKIQREVVEIIIHHCTFLTITKSHKKK